MTKIVSLRADWILDSRGLPTVACTVVVEKNGLQYIGKASVPSGASTGTYEALELRDGGSDFGGKGVQNAIDNVNETIVVALVGNEYNSAKMVDHAVLDLDSSPNKSVLGANAILGVSMATHRAFAASCNQELWQYLRDIYFESLGSQVTFPRLMCNIINGGVHADSGLAIQEFMVIPKTGELIKDVQVSAEIYHTLKANLKKDSHSTSLGDEGGFAPRISTTEEVLQYIQTSVKDSGYSLSQYDIGLDCAASEFFDSNTGMYSIDGRQLTKKELSEFYCQLADKYNVASIEDPFQEDDREGWSLLKQNLKSNVYQIGDDLFVTNVDRFREYGLNYNLASGVLIKLNQIGSVSETCDMVNLAHSEGYVTSISHRSGETTDDFISDLAAACGSKFIKLGAPARGERVAKFNRLLEIQRTL